MNFLEYFYVLGDLSGLNDLAVFLETLLIMMIIAAIISLAVSIASVIGKWKAFSKAGEEGWKALIPIYDIYTFCKISGVNTKWFLIIFVGIFAIFLPLGFSVYMIAILYFRILLCNSIAKSFGKSTSFAIGLFFFAPIFYIMLGFGSSEYIGPAHVNDIIFDNLNKKDNVEADVSLEDVCPSCSSTVSKFDKFCANCGKEL